MGLRMIDTIVWTDLMPQDFDALRSELPDDLKVLLDADREVVF